MADVGEVGRAVEAGEPRMPVATGSRKHTVDPTGRFVVPLDFVAEFGSSFFMTIDEENNLILIPERRFRELARLLMVRRSEERNPNVAAAIKRIFYCAELVKADSSNRIQIPDAVKEMLKEIRAEVPTGPVRICGDGDRIVIQSESNYKDFRDENFRRRDVISHHQFLLRLMAETFDATREERGPNPARSESAGGES